MGGEVPLAEKVGRNEPCPCGSGKKYKKCCAGAAASSPGSAAEVRPSAQTGKQGPLDVAPLFALLRASRHAELEASVRHLLEKHRQAGILWKLLGASLFGQRKDPLAALEKAVQLLPGDPEAHTNLGNALRARGKPDEAAACHRRAIGLKRDYPEAHNNLGSVLRDLGHLDDAAKSFERALSIKADFPLAHDNLGVVLLALGRDEEAIAAHRRALSLAPDFPNAHAHLGRALHKLGRVEEAAASYRRAVMMNPDHAEARTHLGNALRELGRSADAIDSYRAAIALQPDHAEIHNNLGNALLDVGQIEDALQSYRRAIELQPDYAKAHSNLGSALRELGRLDEASDSLQRALALEPKSAEILTNFAIVQRFQADLAGAEASLRRALQLHAASPTTLTGLAELAADDGRFAEAETLYRQAFALNPMSATAWAGIAALRKMSTADADWKDQAERLTQQPLRPREAAQLRFALGKYYDDVKDYANAFKNYHCANETVKTYRPPHDRAQLAQTFEFIARLYDRNFLQQARVRTDTGARPIFIVGMPRSGTTLAEQILASHPKVFGAGELSFWKTASLEVGSATLQQGPSAELSARLAEDYLRMLAGLAPGHPHVVDKMPANFAHLGMIHAALPGARIIHMRRNPVDTCLSIYFQNLHIAHSYSNDLDDLAHYHDEYRRLMLHWQTVLPADAILEVPYEALVDDQETWSRKMVDFVGLDWDDACLDFHRTNRSVSTFSKWQVRQKISKSSVERWRNYEPFVGPLLRLLPTENPAGDSPRSSRIHISS
jgi:tetratricopeptide (TPR) repeat protein